MTADRPTPDPALDAELRALFAAESTAGEPLDPQLDPHLDPERAAAYADGSLAADARERVARHLEECRACAELVLDLDTLRAEPPDDPEVADLEIAAAWRAMRSRLGDVPGTGSVAASSVPPVAPPRRSWVAVLAALFALVALGLGWRLAQLEPTPAVQPNVPIAYLDPVRAGETTVEAPRSGVLLLVLTPSSEPEPGSYRVDVTTPDGVPVLSVDGLEPTVLGTFRVAVAADALPPGEYRVRLGPSGSSASPATDYLLSVGPSDG